MNQPYYTFKALLTALRRFLILLFTLGVAGCANHPWYDNPPSMPEAISPPSGAELGDISTVKFTWRATKQTESYEFHIFNAQTNDIKTYMRKNLKADALCSAELCSMTLALSLPESNRHAWRVRSTNVAGASAWTRRLFSWNTSATTR